MPRDRNATWSVESDGVAEAPFGRIQKAGPGIDAEVDERCEKPIHVPSSSLEPIGLVSLEQRVADLQTVFRKFDQDGGGELDWSELASAVRHLGIFRSPAEMRKLCAEADSDGGGTLGFDEFQKLLQRLEIRRPREMSEEWVEELWTAFERFDTDGGGELDTGEVLEAVHYLGYAHADGELGNLIKGVDEDGGGNLGFEEFMSLVYRLHKL